MTEENNINMAVGKRKKIERLISIFKALRGEHFDTKQWKHRLMLQKIAYIVQMKDKSLYYHFNWFIRGPYSPPLTREEYGDYRESETIEPSVHDAENVRFIKNLTKKTDEHSLELIASVFYLAKEYKIRDPETVCFRMRASKPWFEKEEVISAFEKIINSGTLLA